MRIFDPHIHMVSRITDDYERLALAGVARGPRARVLARPAAHARRDLRRLLRHAHRLGALPRLAVRHPPLLHDGPQPARGQRRPRQPGRARGAAPLPREGRRRRRRRDRPRRPDRRRGASASSRSSSSRTAHGLPVLIHTPHRDKKRGFERCIAMIKDAGFPFERILLDHGNEETIRSRASSAASRASRSTRSRRWTSRAWSRSIREYGVDRIVVNSAADWGISDPLMVPKLVQALLRAGFAAADVQQLVWDNPLGLLRAERPHRPSRARDAARRLAPRDPRGQLDPARPGPGQDVGRAGGRVGRIPGAAGAHRPRLKLHAPSSTPTTL